MKLIILDRDGVINYDSDEYIKSPAEWQPIPGSLSAIAQLTQAGYQIAVATNQSGIARGLYDEAMLAKIHQKMHESVESYGGHIAAVFFCPHINAHNCECRKPKPGLLLQIGAYFQTELQGIHFIGDSYRDIAAGLEVGCKPILVRTGYGEKTLQDYPELVDSIPVYNDLYAVVQSLLI